MLTEFLRQVLTANAAPAPMMRKDNPDGSPGRLAGIRRRREPRQENDADHIGRQIAAGDGIVPDLTLLIDHEIDGPVFGPKDGVYRFESRNIVNGSHHFAIRKGKVDQHWLVAVIMRETQVRNQQAE